MHSHSHKAAFRLLKEHKLHSLCVPCFLMSLFISRQETIKNVTASVALVTYCSTAPASFVLLHSTLSLSLFSLSPVSLLSLSLSLLYLSSLSLSLSVSPPL